MAKGKFLVWLLSSLLPVIFPHCYLPITRKNRLSTLFDSNFALLVVAVLETKAYAPE